MHERGRDARFLLVSGEPERASSRILNFSNFLKNERAVELLNVILENNSPKGYFWQNKMKSEISLPS